MIEQDLKRAVSSALQELYNIDTTVEGVNISFTKKEHEGDFTLVVFPYLKNSGKSPEKTGEDIGHLVTQKLPLVQSFNVVKGFLNFMLTDAAWMQFVEETFKNIDGYIDLKKTTAAAKYLMVEYSSPNTNKPLHLGHIRNNLVGYSVAEILKAAGNKVVKVNLVNDRGIHICKSMLAWKKYGHGETPQSTGMKGDHLVGKYYVEFDKIYKDEVEALNKIASEMLGSLSILKSKFPNQIDLVNFLKSTIVQTLHYYRILLYKRARAINLTEQQKEVIKNNPFNFWIDTINFPVEIKKELIEYHNNLIDRLNNFVIDFTNEQSLKKGISEFFKDASPIILETQNLLRKWEAGDKETIELWKMMNSWVYKGFDETYKALGVDFDKVYYESETYLHGKKIVEDGLNKGVFFKKEDGSVWVDLTDIGLDQKVLLRSDGTAVYMTQDLGTAQLRFDEYTGLEQLIYVVGNEQDYHFKVLKEIFKKLGRPWAEGLYHLSYGMVDLPSGKMKSREGTVVDGDDLIKEITQEAEMATKALGKLDDYDSPEAKKLYHDIGMGALKYFILKVDPKKRMLFNPTESIDLNGNTGPFVQYTYARINSVIRKGNEVFSAVEKGVQVTSITGEKDLIKTLYKYQATIKDASDSLSPSLVANYVYEVAKAYNHFYHSNIIADESNRNVSFYRLHLSALTAAVIKECLRLLGIVAPERM